MAQLTLTAAALRAFGDTEAEADSAYETGARRDAATSGGAASRARSAAQKYGGPKSKHPDLRGAVEARAFREDMVSGPIFRSDWPAPRPDTSPAVIGRSVPVGFARYVSPVIDLGDYEFRRLAAWRVAIPRRLPALRANILMRRIWNEGPAAAGYVRIGGTLVPRGLGPGSRNALSGAANTSLAWM